METPKKKSTEKFVKDIRKHTRRIFTSEQKILIVMEGNYYWHVESNIRKSYSPNKNHTFRFYTSYDRYNYNTPQYLNAELVTSKNLNHNISIEIAYSYLNLLNLSAKQGINLYE